MLRGALQKKKSYPELHCGKKNGSINLELVKSLFISENEEDFGEGAGWGQGGAMGKGKEKGEGGKERKGWENIHQQSNSRNVKKWNGRFTDSRSSLG